MSRPSPGFTLLEIMLAVAIGAIIMVLAVPSISGLMDEQRAERSFHVFDELVGVAQKRAVATRAPARLLLSKDAIALESSEPIATDEAEENGVPAVTSIPISKDEKYVFRFPSALVPDQAAVWTFWPTGACEPAVVEYAGPDSKWSATYDALTAQAEFSTDAP